MGEPARKTSEPHTQKEIKMTFKKQRHIYEFYDDEWCQIPLEVRQESVCRRGDDGVFRVYEAPSGFDDIEVQTIDNDTVSLAAYRVPYIPTPEEVIHALQGPPGPQGPKGDSGNNGKCQCEKAAPTPQFQIVRDSTDIRNLDPDALVIDSSGVAWRAAKAQAALNLPNSPQHGDMYIRWLPGVVILEGEQAVSALAALEAAKNHD